MKTEERQSQSQKFKRGNNDFVDIQGEFKIEQKINHCLWQGENDSDLEKDHFAQSEWIVKDEIKMDVQTTNVCSSFVT